MARRIRAKDELPFLSAIHAAPLDDAPRLVYADWLDEQGKPDFAEFIRLACERARSTCGPDQRNRIEQKMVKLTNKRGGSWLGNRTLDGFDGLYLRGLPVVTSFLCCDATPAEYLDEILPDNPPCCPPRGVLELGIVVSPADQRFVNTSRCWVDGSAIFASNLARRAGLISLSFRFPLFEEQLEPYVAADFVRALAESDLDFSRIVSITLQDAHPHVVDVAHEILGWHPGLSAIGADMETGSVYSDPLPDLTYFHNRGSVRR